MPDISGITGTNGPEPIRKQSSINRSSNNNSDTKSVVGDSVEISSEGSKRAEAAEYAARLKDVADVRRERIEIIQQQIKDGNYDIDGKLGIAMDGLLDEIGIGPSK